MLLVQNTGATNELKTSRWTIEGIRFLNRSTIESVGPLFSLYKNKTKQKPLPMYQPCSLWQSLCFCRQRQQEILLITISVCTDRLSSPPILTLVTWKFILSNCRFCYEHTYSLNIILLNVANSYFQTQALLSFPISIYALPASLTLNYDFFLVAV